MYMMQKGYNGVVDYRLIFSELVNYLEDRYWSGLALLALGLEL